MYDENTNRELNEERTADEHRGEDQTPNFVLNNPGENSQAIQDQVPQNQAPQNQAFQSQQPQNQQSYQNPAGQQPQGQWQYQNTRNQSNQSQGQQYQNPSGQPLPYQNQTAQGTYNRPYNWQNGEQGAEAGSRKANGEHSAHGEKKKRSGGMGRKIAGITAAALLFGTVSGGTMVGVNMLAGSFQKEEAYTPITQPEVSQEEPTTQAAIPSPSVGSSGGAGTALLLDVSDIVEAAMPSVVSINNTMVYEGSNWFGQRQQYEVPGSGSGIIVGKNDEELLIVTNNHVVEGASKLAVVFIDDKSIDAAIKGTDAESDLAVVAVPLKDIPEDTLSQISIAKLGNSEELKVGQGVIAIGNALGYGQSTTVGYISALDREVTTDNSTTRHLLQTDAAINPGNSGGALLNMKGEVIGINAAKYSRTDVEGIGYAIPVSQVQDIIDALMIRRSTIVEEGQEGYLGIQGLTVDESMVKQLDMPAGVFVYAIIDGGAAADSDLREKDVITKFDGQSVRSMAALQDLLRRYKAGETVEVTVESLENGKYVERSVSITLGQKATLGEDS